MCIGNLHALLLPVSDNLQILVLEDCDISPTRADTFLSEGMFAGFPQLQWLSLQSVRATPAFTTFDLKGCTQLTQLDCHSCNLSLNVASCDFLVHLDCSNNVLESLEIAGSSCLETLGCDKDQLVVLELGGCPNLQILRVCYNVLETVELSQCTNLKKVLCDSNNLTLLSLSACVALTSLRYNSNNLSQIDASACFDLINLECPSNNLSKLDLSAAHALRDLDCIHNLIGDIQLNSNAHLCRFKCQRNAEYCFPSSDTSFSRITCDAGTLEGFKPVVLFLLLSLDIWGRDELLDLSGFK